jgi:hypothetical protein
MINVFLEIEKLKATLRNRGLDEESVQSIAQNAEREIAASLQEQMDGAMENAVQSGVEKDSADFINDLRPSPGAFILETASGITDFSDPPYPMLDRLLTNGAKPMKDGSGVYKVIPVGGTSLTPKPTIHSNIFDAQKAIAAERFQQAASQYNKIRPKDSKAKSFKTATSKQSRNTQWVLPAKEKDFTEDLKGINDMLTESHDSIILNVIRSFEEGF